MNQFKIIALFIAICVTAALMGVGIFIGTGNSFGIIICLVIAIILMGLGFSLKKKYLR